MPSGVTRDRILDAAEHQFGDHGYSDTSLRQITDAAGVNLAAVNYHFGSKAQLYREVLLRRVRPLNSERLELLTQAEQLASDQPVPLRAIIETFIRPLLRRAAAEGGAPLLRLLSRDLADPPPFMTRELTAEFRPLMQRYAHALAKTVPGLTLTEAFWRMQFTIGAVLYLAARQKDLGEMSHGMCAGEDAEGCVRRLTDFCAAGFCSR